MPEPIARKNEQEQQVQKQMSVQQQVSPENIAAVIERSSYESNSPLSSLHPNGLTNVRVDISVLQDKNDEKNCFVRVLVSSPNNSRLDAITLPLDSNNPKLGETHYQDNMSYATYGRILESDIAHYIVKQAGQLTDDSDKIKSASPATTTTLSSSTGGKYILSNNLEFVKAPQSEGNMK